MKEMAFFRADSIFKRYEKNPILSAEKWPYPVNAVFNPGATRLKDGTVLLLCRVEEKTGLSHLCAAYSHNGVDSWKIEPAMSLHPAPDSYPEEIWGIEDPRITYLSSLDKYAVAYTSYSRGGAGVSLALTKDFVHYERLGVILPPEDKDAALLPHLIKGKWAIIHRPVTSLGAHIWISYSPDMKNWGGHKLILQARRGAWWDAGKIGLAAPPIETPKGWLILYHGVRFTASGAIYRLGLALLDMANPEKCLLRGKAWIFGPEAPYERFGDVNNVVFPCGYVLDGDGDKIFLYYGAADSCIALAIGSLKELLQWLEENGEPEKAELSPF